MYIFSAANYTFMNEKKKWTSDYIDKNIEILQILANFTWICGSCCSTCCGDIHIFLTGTDIVISDRSQYKLDLSNRSKPFKAMSIELNFEVISKDSESLLYKKCQECLQRSAALVNPSLCLFIYWEGSQIFVNYFQFLVKKDYLWVLIFNDKFIIGWIFKIIFLLFVHKSSVIWLIIWIIASVPWLLELFEFFALFVVYPLWWFQLVCLIICTIIWSFLLFQVLLDLFVLGLGLTQPFAYSQ